jgi:hypothetical protein
MVLLVSINRRQVALFGVAQSQVNNSIRRHKIKTRLDYGGTLGLKLDVMATAP